jgi:hypothetical protein
MVLALFEDYSLPHPIQEKFNEKSENWLLRPINSSWLHSKHSVSLAVLEPIVYTSFYEVFQYVSVNHLLHLSRSSYIHMDMCNDFLFKKWKCDITSFTIFWQIVLLTIFRKRITMEKLKNWIRHHLESKVVVFSSQYIHVVSS